MASLCVVGLVVDLLLERSKDFVTYTNCVVLGIYCQSRPDTFYSFPIRILILERQKCVKNITCIIIS